MENINIIKQLVKNEKASSAFISSLPDIRWACGFSGSNALLLVNPDKAYLITDARYATQSKTEVTGAEVYIAEGALIDCVLKRQLLPAEGEIILQAEHTSLAQHSQLVKRFDDRDWLPLTMFLARHVAIKSPAEIGHIAKAQQITDSVFEELLGFIKPGLTEQEVAAEIIYQHMLRGASGMSFSPIVASGPNGALPHARPTSRVLQKGDMVVLDFGCFVNGYASDMTRTVAIGTPSSDAAAAYEVVLEAQIRAIDNASAKLTSKALDAEARNVIKKAGFGPYFTHSLGHGLGLDVHEWPRISWQSEDQLAENMAITIEPGIYMPGKFGVRIEDIIILKRDGCQIITKSDKQLFRL